jgi:hypothetical protein
MIEVAIIATAVLVGTWDRARPGDHPKSALPCQEDAQQKDDNQFCGSQCDGLHLPVFNADH